MANKEPRSLPRRYTFPKFADLLTPLVFRCFVVMLQFDDDVEGTGMGEGEGKKDVTDQIEDEEQLLGLKGDEPDKDQAEESKELGEAKTNEQLWR